MFIDYLCDFSDDRMSNKMELCLTKKTFNWFRDSLVLEKAFGSAGVRVHSSVKSST